MTNVVTGLAATVGVNDGVSNAQQTFATATMIDVPFGDVELIEYSTLGQSDRYKTKIEGMISPGNMSFEFIYSAADYARCVALKGASKTWQVVVPTDGSGTKTISFTGFLMKATAELKNDAIIMVKVEVGISGTFTVT